MLIWLQDEANLRILLPIAFAVVGGLVRILHKGEEATLRSVLGSLLTSGFVGALVFLTIQDFKLPDGVKVALTGLAGYAGGSMLPAAEKWMEGKTPFK